MIVGGMHGTSKQRGSSTDPAALSQRYHARPVHPALGSSGRVPRTLAVKPANSSPRRRSIGTARVCLPHHLGRTNGHNHC